MDAIRARYTDLCALRDGANKKAGDLKSKLDAANARADTARREAAEYAAQIRSIRGGQEAWFAVKKEIGHLARLLGGK